MRQSSSYKQFDSKSILNLRHVAIIMDGNGRWAKNKGKIRIFGHKAGIEAVRRVVTFSVKNKLEVLTLYAFSTENWNRSIDEVKMLMELFALTLNQEIKNLHKHNVKLKIIGDLSRFSSRIQELISYAEILTRENDGLMLNIAANYGGRWDILQGVKKIAVQIQKGLLFPEQITEKNFSSKLCMKNLAPVDLVIRTGGEYRISNFLLWQIAYAEFWFTDILWPDFNEDLFKSALNAFFLRERRYGGFVTKDALKK